MTRRSDKIYNWTWENLRRLINVERDSLMSQQSNGCLIHYTKETYGDSFGADLLEQYKMYVQSAENVSARRVASSRYLLTLNIALVTLYGIQSEGFGQSYWSTLVPILGILVSVLWYQIIQSHRDLNTVKFQYHPPT